jgi:glycerate 2-kinase
VELRTKGNRIYTLRGSSVWRMTAALRTLSRSIARSRGVRKAALMAVGGALAAVDPRVLVRTRVRRDGGEMTAGGRVYQLGGFRRIYVVGGGKASGLMAAEMERVLAGRIEDGVVVVPDYQRDLPRSKRVTFRKSTHPLPTKKGVEAVRAMLSVAERAREGDLVVCLLSGGGSALMPLPVEGVRVDELGETTQLLLNAGAKIGEINCVRKHLSQIAGGRLVQKVGGAEVLSLVVSDVVGDDLGSIASGPTVPDPTTFAMAREVLARHGIWSDAPASVRATIDRGIQGEIAETPKPGSPLFSKVNNVIVGSNETACAGARESLRRGGYKVPSFRVGVTGEARDVGRRLGRLALKKGSARPWAAVWGGETTVTVKGGGKGGRNQEVALAVAIALRDSRGTAALSVGTDGIDGPTGAAGAICDSATASRARALGLDPEESLDANDSNSFFRSMGDLLVTGPTGTNVSDLMILVKGEP